MIRYPVWHILPLIFFCAVSVEAQQPPRIIRDPSGPPTPRRPTVAEQAELVSHLKAFAAQLAQNPPRLTCDPPSNRPLRFSDAIDVTPVSNRRLGFSNGIDVNLMPNSQWEKSAIDWDRFQADSGYSSFIESRAAAQVHLDLGPLMNDLLVSDAALRFDHMTAFPKHLSTGPARGVAVFHYGETGVAGNRSANIYADRNTGEILRIQFRGFDTPGRAASLQCRAEGN